MSKYSTHCFSALLGLFLLVMSSCAPVFSDLQDARTLGKGNMDATASFTSVNSTQDNETNHLQNQIGAQLAYGVSARIDLRLRYEHLWLDEEQGTANVFGFGPKVSIIKDRLTGYLPVGFAFSSDGLSDGQIHPTILGTIPVSDLLDVNPSFKVLIPFESDFDTSIAFNLGLGLRVSSKFTVRPEYGILFVPGEESGSYGQFSIGTSYKFKD